MTQESREPATEPVFVDETIALARIEAIVANARTTWLVLIGYLAFITMTLLSVRDVDFFSATAVTSLPIINIAIQTTDFFWTAAWLAAVLHIYFHLFLLKLWDALAEAPPKIGKGSDERLKLGERVFPWLVNDWALRRRPDRAAAERPMDWLANRVTELVIWLATPLVLTAFWWRSMTAHLAWLTLLIAGALLASLYASLKGWLRARARLQAPGVVKAEQNVSYMLPPEWWNISTAIGVAVIGIGFLRTGINPIMSHSLWLAPIDLARVEITAKPSDWVGRDTAERRFRVTWCRDRGLPPDACEPPTAPYQEEARTEWCAKRSLNGKECADTFRALDEAFDDEWAETRGEYLANLAKPDLQGRGWRERTSAGRGWRGRSSTRRGWRGRSSTGRGWRGRTSAGRGWRERTSAGRGWRGRTSAGRGWRERTSAGRVSNRPNGPAPQLVPRRPIRPILPVAAI